jgi:hypothetical protein
MITIEKPKSTPNSSLQGDIPAEVMARLHAAYQAPESSSTQGCPDPETVIVHALQELNLENRAKIHAHLLVCKDCLNLVLDVRSARAEAQEWKHQVGEITPIKVQAQSWLAGFVDRVRGSLSNLAPLRRLVAVGVAVMVLTVVGLGVFQHLTAPTSGQLASTMTNLKPVTTYNGKVYARDKRDNVSPTTRNMARTRSLSILGLLLEN